MIQKHSPPLSLLSKKHYSLFSSFSVPCFSGTLPRFGWLLFKPFHYPMLVCWYFVLCFTWLTHYFTLHKIFPISILCNYSFSQPTNIIINLTHHYDYALKWNPPFSIMLHKLAKWMFSKTLWYFEVLWLPACLSPKPTPPICSFYLQTVPNESAKRLVSYWPGC